MKTLLKKTSPLIFLCGLLSACTHTGGPVTPKEGEARKLVSENDYLVDFSKGYSNEFFFANGYKNGDPFMCYWSNEAGQLIDGSMKSTLYKKGDRYYGMEYRSRMMNYHYGYYAVNMKAAYCPGVISSFFTYTHNPVWDEIDIEFLGNNPTHVQFNYYTSGKGGHEYIYNLGFDASKDFHEYGFEWNKDSISWYVDGVKVYTATEEIPTHPQYIMMNLWNVTGHDLWAGRFIDGTLPVSAYYKYFAYIPANS